MKFRAKPKYPEQLDELWEDYIDDEGYIIGWYVDGAIVGKFVEFENEYTVNEFWCKVDVSTLEVVEQPQENYTPKNASPFKPDKETKYAVKVYSLGMLLETVIFEMEGSANEYAESLPYKTIVEVME